MVLLLEYMVLVAIYIIIPGYYRLISTPMQSLKTID